MGAGPEGGPGPDTRGVRRHRDRWAHRLHPQRSRAPDPGLQPEAPHDDGRARDVRPSTSVRHGGSVARPCSTRGRSGRSVARRRGRPGAGCLRARTSGIPDRTTRGASDHRLDRRGSASVRPGVVGSRMDPGCLASIRGPNDRAGLRRQQRQSSTRDRGGDVVDGVPSSRRHRGRRAPEGRWHVEAVASTRRRSIGAAHVHRGAAEPRIDQLRRRDDDEGARCAAVGRAGFHRGWRSCHRIVGGEPRYASGRVRWIGAFASQPSERRGSGDAPGSCLRAALVAGLVPFPAVAR